MEPGFEFAVKFFQTAAAPFRAVPDMGEISQGFVGLTLGWFRWHRWCRRQNSAVREHFKTGEIQLRRL
jgi:hypothetical protein